MDRPTTTRAQMVLLGKSLGSFHQQTRPWSVWPGLLLLWLFALGGLLFDRPISSRQLTALSVVTATAAWLHQRRRRCQLELFQNGLEIRHGKRQRRLCWNQIQEVYQIPLYSWLGSTAPLRQPVSWTLQLVRRDGRTLWLYDFESMPRLSEVVQRQLANRQLPPLLDAYRHGYPIRFGRHLTLDQVGLDVRQRRVTWDEIEAISIDDVTQIRFTLTAASAQQGSPVLAVESGEVPNLALLHQFLELTHGDSAEQHPVELATPRLFEPDEPSAASDAPRAPWQQESDEVALLSSGFDGDDVREWRAGEVTLEELYARGPRHRPKQPR